jgi:hypothetical protein
VNHEIKSAQRKTTRSMLGWARMPVGLLVLLESIGTGIRAMREGERYRTCGALRTAPASDRMGPGC